MMRPTAWPVALTCLALCVGCSHSKPKSANLGQPPSPSPTPNPEAPPGNKAPSVDAKTGGTDDKSVVSVPNRTDGGDTRVGLKKIPSSKVEPIPSVDWGPTKLKPLDIANNIDRVFGEIRNGAADVRLHMLLPIGEAVMKTDAKIATPQRFAVSFPVVDPNPARTVRCTVIANDGRTTELHPGRKPAFSPVKPFHVGGDVNGAQALAKWPTDMPRLAFSHFVEGKNVFAPLVEAMEAPRSGFKVVSQERTSSVDGRYFTNYRILARKVDPKTKKSLAEYEIVVDSHTFAPVTMRTHWTPPGKNATIIEWAGRWYDFKPDAKDFALPK